MGFWLACRIGRHAVGKSDVIGLPPHGGLQEDSPGRSAEKKLGVNPTVVHETYHTLVFHQKWSPSEARQRIPTLMRHPHLEFYIQSGEHNASHS